MNIIFEERLRLIQLTVDSTSVQILHGKYILYLPCPEPNGHIQVQPTEQTKEVMSCAEDHQILLETICVVKDMGWEKRKS